MGKLQGSSLDRRLFHTIGASLLDRTICATAGAAGCGITLGTRAVVDTEAIGGNRLFINWGSNTAVTNSHLWVRMVEARRRGARIITIDPFESRTAERSDQWLAIRPGTDAALAMSIAHVLLRDNLVDHDYLAAHASGLREFSARALAEYAPRTVAEVCGLHESAIEELARLYGTTRPSLIRLNYGLQRHGGGEWRFVSSPAFPPSPATGAIPARAPCFPQASPTPPGPTLNSRGWT